MIMYKKDNEIKIILKANKDMGKNNKIINYIKNIDNEAERKNQIEYSIEKNWINNQEANELY